MALFRFASHMRRRRAAAQFMVVFYLPLVSLASELLLPMAAQSGEKVGTFLLGLGVLFEYLLVLPGCACGLIARRTPRFEWQAEQRYVSSGTWTVFWLFHRRRLTQLFF